MRFPFGFMWHITKQQYNTFSLKMHQFIVVLCFDLDNWSIVEPA